jgi:arsenate reductase (glutaredoxin)
MSDLTYYHNSRCSKSRKGLDLIKEKGFSGRVVNYLNDDVSRSELKMIFSNYKGPVMDLIRKEELMKLTGGRHTDFSTDELIDFVFNNIKVLQRPILASKRDVVIGRPTENLVALL